MLAPVAAVVPKVFKSSVRFCLDPVLAFRFKSACLIVSLEKTLAPSCEVREYRVL